MILLTGEVNENGRMMIPYTYFEAIRLAGGIPVAVCAANEAEARTLAARADALFLTGGGDVDAERFGQAHNPKSGKPNALRDETEIQLVHAFVELKKPILGVCRGMQTLAVALGGDLHQHVPDVFGEEHDDMEMRHEIDVIEGSFLTAATGKEKLIVNSSHHQSVRNLPEGFRVAAVTKSGIIEAMERDNLYAVQFHPERIIDEGFLCIFQYFINLIKNS